MKQAPGRPLVFQDLPTFAAKGRKAVHAVIETPRNQRHKYAFDRKAGAFRLSMILAEGLQWPYDYGFVPQTIADDGDPLDVLYLTDAPTFPGCVVVARPIGIVRIEKNGVENDRLLACPARQTGLTQKSDEFDDVDDVPKDMLESICRYLVEYSVAEGNELVYRGTGTRKKALKAIRNACKAYFKKRSRDA